MILIGLSCYWLSINGLGYYLMKKDKGKAQKQQWRIPERKLFLVAILGGSLGVWLAMKKFRHKTKHLRFCLLIPLIFIIQVVMVTWIIKNFYLNI